MMQPEQLLEDLQRQERELRAVLLDMEGKFNLKKEQYLKVQGAIEGLAMLTPEGTPPIITEDNVEP
tara:strand:+ start:1648 stop:1845 length:198 start_codon:yes stop_codon:yes gene_type:complete